MNVKNIFQKITSPYSKVKSYIKNLIPKNNKEVYFLQHLNNVFGARTVSFMKQHKSISFAIAFTLFLIIYGIISNIIKGNYFHSVIFTTILLSVIITIAICRLLFIIDYNDKQKEKESLKKKKWRDLKRKEGEMVLQKYGYITPSEKRPMRRKGEVLAS